MTVLQKVWDFANTLTGLLEALREMTGVEGLILRFQAKTVLDLLNFEQQQEFVPIITLATLRLVLIQSVKYYIVLWLGDKTL